MPPVKIMHINFLAVFFLLNIVSAVPLLTASSPATKKTSLGVAVPRIGIIAPANLKGVKVGNISGYARRPISKHSKISCASHVVKRQNGLVQKAVLAAKEQVEDGMNSKTLLTIYDGHPAVLKIICNKEREDEVIDEVRNLKTVHQFFGWGHNENKSIFYIVMHKMGEPFEIANKKAKGALSDVFSDLEFEAFQRYKTMYGLRHLDIHHHNYVFHKTSPGKWQAELIDWGKAEVMDGVKRPCEGKAELVMIDHH